MRVWLADDSEPGFGFVWRKHVVARPRKTPSCPKLGEMPRLRSRGAISCLDAMRRR